MRDKYTEGQTFEKIDYTTEKFLKGEYEECTFINCNLSGTDLSSTRFVDCTFKDCNMGNAKFGGTTMNNVTFTGCKLMGLQFGDCDSILFSVSFSDCTLNYSSFFKMPLKKTTFKNCQVHEADLTEADLSSATFDNCDLHKTLFERTNLEKADLRTSYNYSIDPEKNKLKKARFSIEGLPGLLHKYDITVS